jgi:hypothetical protein
MCGVFVSSPNVAKQLCCTSIEPFWLQNYCISQMQLQHTALLQRPCCTCSHRILFFRTPPCLCFGRQGICVVSILSSNLASSKLCTTAACHAEFLAMRLAFGLTPHFIQHALLNEQRVSLCRVLQNGCSCNIVIARRLQLAASVLLPSVL